MSEVPAELRYTPEHEWIRVEGDQAIIGVTDYAQDALTDVVWVELPEVGMSVGAMESCGSVESVKSVSEIYAPIVGEVTEANESLEDAPEQINQDPYGDGWIWKMTISDAGELEGLLDAAAYSELIGEGVSWLQPSTSTWMAHVKRIEMLLQRPLLAGDFVLLRAIPV